MSLAISPWKYGKQWVYSITYDEALADLHRFAVPIHEDHGIPGHVEVVVGQMGQTRKIGNSSYNGYRHMSASELKELMHHGWGVGNHSWSHEIITTDTVEHEIGTAKEVLEQALGSSVFLFCSPGDNTNMSNHVLEACRRHGYLGAMSITDGLNRPDEEMFWINRTPLHDHFYGPFFSAFDPYRNIRQAQADHGWLIDYCHCPLEAPVHPNKDCSESQLRRRFEAIAGEGGDHVWCTTPEEALSYHLLRRSARIESIEISERAHHYRVYLPEHAERLPYSTLTLEAPVPVAWSIDPHVSIDGQRTPAELLRPQVLRFTADINNGTDVLIEPQPH